MHIALVLIYAHFLIKNSHILIFRFINFSPSHRKKSDNFSGNYVLAYRGIYMTNINQVYLIKKEKIDLIKYLRSDISLEFENLEEIFFFDEENIN